MWIGIVRILFRKVSLPPMQNTQILNRSIGILGCGWLGLPLARSFIAEGYRVNGSTTSEEKVRSLQNEGINTFLIQLKETTVKGKIPEFLKNVHVLIINVPPRLRGNNTENYVKKMNLLHTSLKGSQVKKVLFVSSTSVYGDISGEVTEDSHPKPITESGRQLLEVEKVFRNDSNLEVSIIRFGGLIGPKRHPITMLAGKNGLSNGNQAVNLIHLDDCIAIIKDIVMNNWWDEIFNGVYPLHPKKSEYYSKEAHKRGLSMPIYGNESLKRGKIIMPFNLINVKKYRFKTSIVS